MLNRIKKAVLPMLDTLGEALSLYIKEPSDGLRADIAGVIDAVNKQFEDKSSEINSLAAVLISELENPLLANVQEACATFCAAVQSAPVQYKAVFLPYYDNTWDSLESVYRAFSADPMFVTEIVIIPICRNTPTGWTIVYKDYLTPEGIPNTPFNVYDFQKDLPDFVFFNNPYDGVNIPKFQFAKIRPYVECMVYIPYALYRHSYALNVLDAASKNAVVDITSRLAGHDVCDILVSQGKYDFDLTRYNSGNGRKAVALGNPKTDNIFKHMQSSEPKPEWDAKLQGKTVFLLNTHYSASVSGEYKEILSCLMELLENNNQMAVVWRPHPLSFVMFEGREDSPEHVEWQSFIESANAHSSMICDRTPNAVDAIIYCSALITHQSSVIAETLFADKPVFLIDMKPKKGAEFPIPAAVHVTAEAYADEQKRLAEYDTEDLFLQNAICHMGIEYVDYREEQPFEYEYMLRNSLTGFVNEILAGADSKKDLRKLFREQLFATQDGTCGRKIHDYIVSVIEKSETQ